MRGCHTNPDGLEDPEHPPAAPSPGPPQWGWSPAWPHLGLGGEEGNVDLRQGFDDLGGAGFHQLVEEGVRAGCKGRRRRKVALSIPPCLLACMCFSDGDFPSPPLLPQRRAGCLQHLPWDAGTQPSLWEPVMETTRLHMQPPSAMGRRGPSPHCLLLLLLSCPGRVSRELGGAQAMGWEP